MEGVRKPFQGVRNIIRFNWHLYALALLFIALLLIANAATSHRFLILFLIISTVVFLSIFVSLVTSFYIYDCSSLYTLNWLNKVSIKSNGKLVNIHSGFDETSILIQKKIKEALLTVFDFYDPQKHTEISIKIARKAYPPFPGTQSISSTNLPLKNQSADAIFLLLAAHEIRNSNERKQFFKELNRVLAPNGKIIVTEHVRDGFNLLAYNLGAFHFHTRASWLSAFKKGGFAVADEIKTTPFITTFILHKNGTAS